jgi:hypothetical protein
MGTNKIKPLIFNAQLNSLRSIKKEIEVNTVIDSYKEQLEDLFLIRNPRFRFNKNYKKELEDFIFKHSNGDTLERCGNWVYFPWNKNLVHYLEKDLHQEIRTARNKNLITEEEQNKIYNAKIGIAGLSVGSHGALAIALMGVSKKIKLADPDVVSPTNLNRIISDFTNVGINKAELIGRYIYQLNPYVDLEIYTEGINTNNMVDFIKDLDILVEELDDIKIKYEIRIEARKRKIPVIMATDNGDNVIIDIERYDLNSKQLPFHGSLEGFEIESIDHNPLKLYEAMAKIIDLSFVPTRVIKSINEVGKTIYSWPQLITAAMLSGSVISYVVKKIILNEKIRSGKLEVNLDKIFDLDYNKELKERKKMIFNFKKSLKIKNK